MHLELANVEPKEIMPGFHGRMVHSETMTLAFWEVDENAEVPEHSHKNEQVMHVIEGEFQLTLEEETKNYFPGDIVVIAPYKTHSGKALTPCKLLDVFSPPREEYR